MPQLPGWILVSREAFLTVPEREIGANFNIDGAACDTYQNSLIMSRDSLLWKSSTGSSRVLSVPLSHYVQRSVRNYRKRSRKPPMHQSTEIIATQRLRLRSLTCADVQPLHDHVLSDAVVMALALSGQPMSSSQSKEFIDRNFERDAGGKKLGVLIERATEQVIGFAGLLQCDALGEPDYELGFVLRRSAWGHGYATEIGRGQLEYGFSVLGLRRLLALVAPKNNTSITVLKKIGMELYSTVHSDQRGDRRVYVAWNSMET